jgi:hypothetical protein
MNRPDFQLELAAATSFARVLTEAEDCRKLHQKAGIALPAPLLRLFGEATDMPKQLLLRMPGPDADPARLSSRPPEAREDWISIWATDATPTTVALAILRDQIEPIRAKDLSNKVTALLPQIVSGSIYNLLNRLAEMGYVKRKDTRWFLAKKDIAPILVDDFLWAAPDKFAKQDLAALRREAILHILSNERSLQVMQLVDKLKAWDWVKAAPISKDLLKIDMSVLEEKGRVRRVGNSRNWEITGE